MDKKQAYHLMVASVLLIVASYIDLISRVSGLIIAAVVIYVLVRSIAKS